MMFVGRSEDGERMEIMELNGIGILCKIKKNKRQC